MFLHLDWVWLTEDYKDQWWLSYFIWIGLGIFFTMLAASIGEYVSRDAEGSGVPELKSILAGVNIYWYLSMQALLEEFWELWGLCYARWHTIRLSYLLRMPWICSKITTEYRWRYHLRKSEWVSLVAWQNQILTKLLYLPRMNCHHGLKIQKES